MKLNFCSSVKKLRVKQVLVVVCISRDFRTSKRIETVQNLAAKKKQELDEQVKDISKHFKEFDKYRK
ncbi:hypothetical protein MKX03_036557 [Papaver bracteatum]|nr:hypothetical protein MKX03_036557 [Papaver bracteatum]